MDAQEIKGKNSSGQPVSTKTTTRSSTKTSRKT